METKPERRTLTDAQAHLTYSLTLRVYEESTRYGLPLSARQAHVIGFRVLKKRVTFQARDPFTARSFGPRVAAMFHVSREWLRATCR